ncbi:hypothetical protein BLNAU_22474 [Blattamonas nauphoetae]|uniref:Uncharacterized protein n=1 Tax=Blattamonas nauphoetae TaxID=2049346 RepID=A0ABQ9WSY8_9EUKA|nr:hypothetical protein BLNAU_22474 [Blattamonas nauphoetae]
MQPLLSSVVVTVRRLVLILLRINSILTCEDLSKGWYYVGEVFMKDVVEMGYDRGKNELVATTIARLSTPTRVSFFLANFLPGRCTSTARDVVRSSKPFCAVPIPDLIVGAGCLCILHFSKLNQRDGQASD